MLNSLFGNKTVAKILLYLLVNERCYATQLHRVLGTPLTPLQKGLMRLERGQIVQSSYEGKTRVYRFNPAYPLLAELEVLLKTGFNQLTPSEKSRYYYLSEKEIPRKEQHQLLELVWNQLKTISRMTLAAKSNLRKGWTHKGNGVVTALSEENSIIFNEQGSWKNDAGQQHNYSNSFRWTWKRQEKVISLEHLRFGPKNPVFLFHLLPTKGNILESLHSHLCGEDTYFGRLKYGQLFLQLSFRTIGPKKNEEIEYIYT